MKPFNRAFKRLVSTAGYVQLIRETVWSLTSGVLYTDPGVRKIDELHDGLLAVEQYRDSQLSTIICRSSTTHTHTHTVTQSTIDA